MKLTWFFVVRCVCIISVLNLLNRNGVTYQDLDFWLVLLIMMVFGLSESIEQIKKRYE